MDKDIKEGLASIIIVILLIGFFEVMDYKYGFNEDKHVCLEESCHLSINGICEIYNECPIIGGN